MFHIENVTNTQFSNLLLLLLWFLFTLKMHLLVHLNHTQQDLVWGNRVLLHYDIFMKNNR